MYLRKHERHFAAPKTTTATKTTIPASAMTELPWIAGRLAPAERKAMRDIVEHADIIHVDGFDYLIAEVLPRTIETLSAFEGEAEDREPDVEDEPDDHGGDGEVEDKEPSLAGSTADGHWAVDLEEAHSLPMPGEGKTREAIVARKRARFDGGQDYLEGRRVKRLIGGVR